jgi:hypothetical protein
MKFTTTNNTEYRKNIGQVPRPWISYQGTDHEACVYNYFDRNIRLFDFDICGDETHDFLFDDGRAFRLEYSWWAEWFHDDIEQNGLKEEYFIEEISPDQANVPTQKDRNWL